MEAEKARIRGLRRTKTTADLASEDGPPPAMTSFQSKERSSPQLRKFSPALHYGTSALSSSGSVESAASPRATLVRSSTNEDTIESEEPDGKPVVPKIAGFAGTQQPDPKLDKTKPSPRSSMAKKSNPKGISALIPASPRKARPHDVKRSDLADSIEEVCSETSEEPVDLVAAVKEKEKEKRRMTLGRLPLGRKSKPDTVPALASPKFCLSLDPVVITHETTLSDSPGPTSPESRPPSPTLSPKSPSPITNTKSENAEKGLSKEPLPSHSRHTVLAFSLTTNYHRCHGSCMMV